MLFLVRTAMFCALPAASRQIVHAYVNPPIVIFSSLRRLRGAVLRPHRRASVISPRASWSNSRRCGRSLPFCTHLVLHDMKYSVCMLKEQHKSMTEPPHSSRDGTPREYNGIPHTVLMYCCGPGRVQLKNTYTFERFHRLPLHKKTSLFFFQWFK